MARCAKSLLFFAAILLVLAGCAAPSPQPPPEVNWQQQLAALTALEDWGFNGKVAVSTPSGSETARLRWAQQGSRSELVLSGPVGWNRATLVSDGSRLRLQRDGEWQEFGLDDHRALEEQLGWPLPLNYLPYWVRGMPAPGPSIEQLDVIDGKLAELRQDGWHVEYRAYQQAGGLLLPERIHVSRQGVSGKLILTTWQVGSRS